MKQQEGAAARKAMHFILRDKNVAFWTLQLAGWFGYGLVRWLNGLARGWEFEYLYPSIVAMIAGFLITLGMRYVFRLIRNRGVPVIVTISFFLSILLAIAFSAIEVWGHTTFYLREWRPEDFPFWGNTMLDAYVLLSWTALYFSINYYLLLREQREQTLKASAMAHQAQLKMLRYQLNPHFLFNTLNAISTLVLEKDIKLANNMLTRLSAFLRYTLVNQPRQKVTLDQELYALGLYLEIEKVRFQDRLKLTFNIEEKARTALIPNLLLQPLIENAVKYAIAPSEDGGEISLTAEILENNLCIFLQDNGPGLKEIPAVMAKESSGVGISNTRERLKQIYGGNHEFTLTNTEPNGLSIKIVIPCELTEKQKAA